MMREISELKIPLETKQDIETITGILLDKFKEEISKIILFGSYATGKYQPDSDIDIAVVLNELPDVKHRRQYKQAVEIDDIDIEADVVFCSAEQLLGNAFVYRHINEQGVVLYEQL